MFKTLVFISLPVIGHVALVHSLTKRIEHLQPWSTDSEVVWPQSTDGVFGQLCEEESGKSSKCEEAKMTIKLHYDPGGAIIAEMKQ